MLIRLMSDLHLEFSSGDMDVPVLPTDKDTVLILAGDIGLAKKPYTYNDFLEKMSSQFRDVIYILGNHEHYKGSFENSKSKIYLDLLSLENVHVMEKESITIDDTTFIAATLWTDMNCHDTLCMYQAKLTMNDYKTIRVQNYKRKLDPKDTVADHLNARHYIFKEIEKHDKTVVITHHAPSYKSIAEEFRGDSINGAYVSELFEDIADTKPDVWIHGHTHTSLDYKLEDTRVICNPRGYYTESGKYLNKDFNPKLLLEI